MKPTKRSKTPPTPPVFIQVGGITIASAQPLALHNGEVVDPTPKTVYTAD